MVSTSHESRSVLHSDNEGGATSYEYNWVNKLRTGTKGTNTVNFKYDPSGNRALRQRNYNGTITMRKFIVDVSGDLPTILLEIDATNGSLKRTYVYANSEILAQHNGPADTQDVNFYLHDRLGSTRQVINKAGSVVRYYSFDPFGKQLEGGPTALYPFMFTGQYYDYEIGQYYLRARQYDPILMRFTGRDLVKGQRERPLTLHKYIYCLNNTINCSDPSGLLFTGVDIANHYMRRDYLKMVGSEYEGLANCGVVSDLKALADLTDCAAFWAKRVDSAHQLVSDLLWMFTERDPLCPLVNTKDNLYLQFGDSGFREEYRDGYNQVRHFVGCLAVGYYLGYVGGRAAVIDHEGGFSADLTDPDVTLGFKAVDLGFLIMMGKDLNCIGYWIKENIGYGDNTF